MSQMSLLRGALAPPVSRGLKDHTNIRILHSDSKAQDQWNSSNHGLYDPCVYVGFGAPNFGETSCLRAPSSP